MKSDWEARVAELWKSADDGKAAEMLVKMKSLVSELEPNDPDGLFEWASIHDYLGLEVEAVAIYKQTLESGPTGLKSQKAVIQLASSLRNIGKANEAVVLLETNSFDDEMGVAAKAFLALAYFDSGNPAKALSIALDEFYPAGAIYERSIKLYAQELNKRTDRKLP
jgi:tetratricopeptide (TPR) repeat protein